jgi:hypothetical protein
MESSPATQLKVQSEIAACMKRSGFVYFPFVIPSVLDAYRNQRGAVNEKEFFRREGFGVFTTFSAEGPSIPEATKNDQYLASLNTAGRAAYLRALTGQVVEGSRERLRPNCSSDAEDRTFGKGRVFLGQVGVARQQAEERVDANPIVIAAYRDWRSCVRGKTGQTFNHPVDIANYLSDKSNRIISGSAELLATGAKATLVELMADGAAEERRLALAASECQDTHLTAREKLLRDEGEKLMTKFRKRLVKLPFVQTQADK